MLLAKAVVLSLTESDASVATLSDLHHRALGLFAARFWQDEPLKRLPKSWDQRRSKEMVARLVDRKLLIPDADFGGEVYRVAAVTEAPSAEAVAILVDPYCYVSHGSAVHLHGLSSKRPSPLHLSTPERRQWRARRAADIAALGLADVADRLSYNRVHFSDRLRRRSVVLHETSSPAATIALGPVRVSTLGATFLDTLAEPARCGGMGEVLKLWDQHARSYLAEIVAAVDQVETKILKVRAGYILTERLGLEQPEISVWQAFAQRGGSRKLDPDRPYAPIYSERWMLSLNAEDA